MFFVSEASYPMLGLGAAGRIRTGVGTLRLEDLGFRFHTFKDLVVPTIDRWAFGVLVLARSTC